jgi:hypothetical protein
LGEIIASNQWVSVGLLFALLIAAIFLGRILGLRSSAASPGGASGNLHEASALGVLALLLGFSFSMAAGKFDQRRALILTQADTISTFALRVELLAPGASANILEKLVAYSQNQVRTFEAGADNASRKIIIQESENLQTEMWEDLMRAMPRDVPRSSVDSLIVATATDLFDIHNDRKYAYSVHIPDAAYLLLFVTALIAFGLSGYAAGAQGRSSPVPSIIMAFLACTVIMFIIDLDHPLRGYLRLSDDALVSVVQDVQRSLARIETQR